MVQKSRSSPVRGRLNVEPLEDRTVPSGPSGVVTAMLGPTNGIIMIQGDGGNNALKISASPLGANLLRVAGVGFTSVNGVSFTDFTLSSITNITVNFLNGNENLTVQGVSIPGNLQVTAGNGGNTFS